MWIGSLRKLCHPFSQLCFEFAFLKAFTASGIQDPLLVADGFFTWFVHGFILGPLGYPVNRFGRLEIIPSKLKRVNF